MRYAEPPPTNGHPIWELLASIHTNIGRLQAGQEITLEEVRSNRRETREVEALIHQRIDRDVIRLHQRIDKEVRARRLPRWLEWTGLGSLTEAVLLAALAVGSLTGTVTLDAVLTALGGK